MNVNHVELRRFKGMCRRAIFPLIRRRRHHFSRVLDLSVTTPFFGEWDTIRLVLSAFEHAPLKVFDDMWRHHIMWGGSLEGQYDYFDMVVLWGIIRYFNVTRVVECSPHKGWSTTVIQLSLGEGDTAHLSFDICDYEKQIRDKARRYVPPRNWQFVLGDFRETAWRHMDFVSTADMIFLDSAHSEEFARWYLDEFQLLHRIRNSALVHIHDVYPTGLEPAGFGESPYVLDWVRRHRDSLQIFWTYEVSRLPEVVEVLPEKTFLNHAGTQAPNCSLWLTRNASHPGEPMGQQAFLAGHGSAAG